MPEFFHEKSLCCEASDFQNSYFRDFDEDAEIALFQRNLEGEVARKLQCMCRNFS